MGHLSASPVAVICVQWEEDRYGAEFDLGPWVESLQGPSWPIRHARWHSRARISEEENLGSYHGNQ